MRGLKLLDIRTQSQRSDLRPAARKGYQLKDATVFAERDSHVGRLMMWSKPSYGGVDAQKTFDDRDSFYHGCVSASATPSRRQGAVAVVEPALDR